MQGAAPCRPLAGRGRGLSPRGIRGGCRTLILTVMAPGPHYWYATCSQNSFSLLTCCTLYHLSQDSQLVELAMLRTLAMISPGGRSAQEALLAAAASTFASLPEVGVLTWASLTRG